LSCKFNDMNRWSRRQTDRHTNPKRANCHRGTAQL
jgi:hypothetical protein